MTRPQTLDELRRLVVGLSTDDASVRRLLERISQAEEPERLRALLTELGARSLIDEYGGAGGTGARLGTYAFFGHGGAR